MNSPQISGTTAGEAWANAIEYLLSQPSRGAVNLGVKIASPVEDVHASRLLNEFLRQHNLPRVETVANTVFPRHLAARSEDSAELVRRYCHLRPALRRHGKNRTGTYFERIVAYSSGGQSVDQLSDLIGKLRDARNGSRRVMSSRYEMVVYDPAHDRRKTMGFPCLSFLSFHLHEDQVHLAGHYRNHCFVERAYGNYVGLGALLAYVAAESSWPAGEMLIVSGHAEIERGRRARLQQLVQDLRAAAPPQPGL